MEFKYAKRQLEMAWNKVNIFQCSIWFDGIYAKWDGSLPNAKSGNYDFRLPGKIFCEIPNIKGKTEKDVS